MRHGTRAARGDQQERHAVMAEPCLATNAGVRPSMPTTIAIRPQRASRLLAGMRAASPDAADGFGRCHSTMRDRRLGGPDESAIGTETARVMP
jgi:hypothetical protein